MFDAVEDAGVRVDAYRVIEKPAVCEFFAPRHRSQAVSYVSIDEEPKSAVGDGWKWTVAYANSALQYASDNSYLLALIAAGRPTWVLLDDVLTTPAGHDVFALQVNSDSPIVVRFVSVGALTSEFDAYGFKLRVQMPFGGAPFRNRCATTDSDVLTEEPRPLTLLFERDESLPL